MNRRALLSDKEWHDRFIPLKEAVFEWNGRDGALYGFDSVADMLGRLGFNIRWLAEESGLSLKQLCERAGISERGLHHILAGRKAPTLFTLALIGVTLGVDPVYLLLPNDDLKRRLRKAERQRINAPRRSDQETPIKSRERAHRR
jgi:transcriptional regulator with XRE-family HTH domain